MEIKLILASDGKWLATADSVKLSGHRNAEYDASGATPLDAMTVLAQTLAQALIESRMR